MRFLTLPPPSQTFERQVEIGDASELAPGRCGSRRHPFLQARSGPSGKDAHGRWPNTERLGRVLRRHVEQINEHECSSLPRCERGERVDDHVPRLDPDVRSSAGMA